MKQYLELMARVLAEGEERTDRTGTGTLSLFGTQTRYDLEDGFPLVTTKKLLFDSVAKELFWFLRGETNIQTLGCGIWDAWADEQGELGPIYGHQWRRWGAPLGGVGRDQIAKVVADIQQSPDSRRLIVSAWNADEIEQMALAPCHTLFQFHVSRPRTSEARLNLQLYQRSADLAVGVPFNIASYALLLVLVASATGLKPGVFVHTIGDAHLYLDHLEGVRKQLTRTPHLLPRLNLKRVPDLSSPEAFDLQLEDLVLEGYTHHPFIKFPVAV